MRKPMLSLHVPKYPLLNPATASARPSSTPMAITEKQISLKYNGITGYSISLAISVNKLTNDKSKTVRVIILLMAESSAFVTFPHSIFHCTFHNLLPVLLSGCHLLLQLHTQPRNLPDC